MTPTATPHRWRRFAARTAALVAAAVVLGLAAYGGFELVSRRRGVEAVSPPAAAHEPSAPPATAAGHATMRHLIQQAVERAGVKEPAELEAYLARLEAQAREKGQVTALEIEPGMTIALDHATPERAQAFAERMRALQRELETQAAPPASATANSGAEPTPAITTADMRGGLARIATASGSEKQALIRQYVRAAEGLAEEDELARLAELNRVAGPPRPPADVSAIETLRARVGAASSGPEREALIREYRDLVSELPEEEEARRLAELNRLIGATR